MRLLLISNSTNQGEPYLDYPKGTIKEFLGDQPVKALFIPYAAVTFSYSEYEARVSERFLEIGHEIVSIHRYEDKIEAVKKSTAIVIGGGNTWMLLKRLQDNNLSFVLHEKVLSGTPYIGWSAGSNVACPTIMTTNDMPVAEPHTLEGLNLIPFQINPHFTNQTPAGHTGETREERIREFIEINRNVYVAGLREGTMLIREGEKISLIGKRPVRIFRYNSVPAEFSSNDDLSFLLR